MIAAAGLIALEKSPARLHVDHENAKRLAEGIAEIPGLTIDPKKVRSNIVIFDCSKTGKTAVELCDALYPQGVWAQDTALYSVRMVTHCDVDRAGCERALVVLKEVVSENAGRSGRVKGESDEERGVFVVCAVAGIALYRRGQGSAVCRRRWRRRKRRRRPQRRRSLSRTRSKRCSSLGVKASRASWVQENFITDDTEQIAAEASEVVNTASTKYAKKAHRFDGLKLSPELARKRLLLELATGFPAPDDPKAQKELAQVLASLDGDYGKGKWCPEGDKGKCLDVTAVEKLMADEPRPGGIEARMGGMACGWRADAAAVRADGGTGKQGCARDWGMRMWERCGVRITTCRRMSLRKKRTGCGSNCGRCICRCTPTCAGNCGRNMERIWCRRMGRFRRICWETSGARSGTTFIR